MSSGLEDIGQSIRIILDTVPGEWIMRPDFGCYLKRMVFERIDLRFVTEVNDIIGHALLRFEPRIVFDNVEVMQENDREGVVKLQINFTLIRTNTRHNIVYPFYLQQGTNLGN